MLVIALTVYLGRKWWFVRPVEKHLSEVVLDDTTLLSKQKQSIENQSSMQRELLQRDINSIQQEWVQIERILQLIREFIS
jgi:hypothetical protein